MSSDLPRGLKYKIEKAYPGIIAPGTDNEPIITISGRGATLQYRLVTFYLKKYARIDETYCEGNLEQEDEDNIETWISQNLPSLFSEARIRHLIYFVPNSRCYYDFIFKKLYGANGVKEKKNQRVDFKENITSVEGGPCSLTPGEIAFIDVLTEYPNTPTSPDRFYGEDAESSTITTAKSLDQTWYRFRRYDSSIKTAFKREQGYFIYRGNPQIWIVGGEYETPNLSIESIIKLLDVCDIVATLDGRSRRFNAALISDHSYDELLDFLGLNTEPFDLDSFSINQLVKENYCDSVDEIKKLYKRYSPTLEAVWNQLKDSISVNYTSSIGASLFYKETGELPKRLSDLNGYRPEGKRLDNLLKQICPAVEKTIRESRAGINYFGSCNIDVTPENAIDYIVALVLSCFSDCQTPSTDEELIRLRGVYQQKLRSLIGQKFGFNPPSGGNGSFYDELEELRKRLFELQEQAISDGLIEYASAIAEIRNSYILGYNDENSLLPPSMGREL